MLNNTMPIVNNMEKPVNVRGNRPKECPLVGITQEEWEMMCADELEEIEEEKRMEREGITKDDNESDDWQYEAPPSTYTPKEPPKEQKPSRSDGDDPLSEFSDEEIDKLAKKARQSYAREYALKNKEKIKENRRRSLARKALRDGETPD